MGISEKMVSIPKSPWEFRYLVSWSYGLLWDDLGAADLVGQGVHLIWLRVQPGGFEIIAVLECWFQV